MKINQFARLDIDHKQKIEELKKIRFLTTNDLNLSLNKLFTQFLNRAFIEDKSKSSFDQHLHALLATNTQDLKDYLDQKK